MGLIAVDYLFLPFMILVSVQSQTASMLLRKRNNPTAYGPMLKKMKNKERKFKTFKADTKKVIQAKHHQLTKPTNPIITSNDAADIFLSIPNHYGISPWICQIYMQHKGATLNLTDEELLTFFGIPLTNSVPRRRLLW